MITSGWPGKHISALSGITVGVSVGASRCCSGIGVSWTGEGAAARLLCKLVGERVGVGVTVGVPTPAVVVGVAVAVSALGRYRGRRIGRVNGRVVNGRICCVVVTNILFVVARRVSA